MGLRQNCIVLGVSIRWQSRLEVSHIDKHPISPEVQYRNALSQNILDSDAVSKPTDAIYLLFLLQEGL